MRATGGGPLVVHFGDLTSMINKTVFLMQFRGYSTLPRSLSLFNIIDGNAYDAEGF